jgi:hypothetical protein
MLLKNIPSQTQQNLLFFGKDFALQFKGLLEKAEAEKELIELEQRQAELEKKRDDGLARAKIVNKRKLEAPLKANKKRKKANKSKPKKFKTMFSFFKVQIRNFVKFLTKFVIL